MPLAGHGQQIGVVAVPGQAGPGVAFGPVEVAGLKEEPGPIGIGIDEAGLEVDDVREIGQGALDVTSEGAQVPPVVIDLRERGERRIAAS